MKILSVSNMDIWMWGEGKGIPSIFYPQKEFAKRGYGVYFLCPIKDGEPRYCCISGIHIYRHDFPFNYKKNVYIQTNNIFNKLKATIVSNLNWIFYLIFAFFEGLKIGLKIRPDIIYCHNLMPASISFLISKILKAKFIIRVYGTRQLYWRWPSLWYRVKESRDYLSFKVPADYYIITNDGNYGNLLAEKLGVQDKKIRYWRNGINEEFYMTNPDARKDVCRQFNIDPSYRIIASTCRLIPDYRVDKLLYSFKGVFEKKPDCICLIAGSGPEHKRLEKIAYETGISSRVLFLGIVDRKTIKKILDAADIFVLLSRYHNCTNTMWEAMASGKCIVTTETEAIKEVLTSGENAVLVPQEKLEGLSNILLDILEDDQLRLKLGRNAKQRALQILEPWEKRIEKEAILLEELIRR